MADLTNLADKVCRAFWWYLIENSDVDINHAFHHFDSRERKFSYVDANGQAGPELPIVDVMLKTLHPEEQFTGNDVFLVEVQVKLPGVTQPDAASDDAQRIAFGKVVGQVRQLLMLSNDNGQSIRATRDKINGAAWSMAVATDPKFAAAHADMADFTLLSMYQDVYGVATSKVVNWALVQRYKVSACESRIVDAPDGSDE